MAVEKAVEQAAHTLAASTGLEHEAAHHTGIHVALAAEKIGTFLGLPITNTLLTSWIVMALLIAVGLWMNRRVARVPGRLQTALEMVFSFFYDFVADTLESRELARKFFPLLMTTFFFIWIANAVEFTPGIGSIGFFHEGGEFTPLFRSVNTDLNMTLALTFIAVGVIEVTGVLVLGFRTYMSKFFTLKSPVATMVGIIELVGELARIVSFSFRLFGNIFAGEVLIAVVAFFVPYVLPVPLMAFEMFVGLVQAAIFTLLMLFFIKMAITHHDEGDEKAHAH